MQLFESWNQILVEKIGLGSRYLICMLWLFYIIACSYFLFMRGFLLNREVLPFHSSCQVHDSFCTNLINQSSYMPVNEEALLSCLFQDEHSEHNNSTIISSQWCPSRKVRVILLVIDALRYDFTLYNNSNYIKPLPYQNKLSIIHQTLMKYPDRSRLYQFIADPPTTTMQRLNGLTTGSLPTFIDIVKNFASSEIVEDNIIDHVRARNKSIVFMGDDTWIGLYPNRFLRHYAFPSFNTWDLDTVDKGVRKHLIPEVEKTDWDLLIAHFLGVDHCGHRYGPHHLEMKRKLLEINQTIGYVLVPYLQGSQAGLLYTAPKNLPFFCDLCVENNDKLKQTSMAAWVLVLHATGPVFVSRCFQPCEDNEVCQLLVNQYPYCKL